MADLDKKSGLEPGEPSAAIEKNVDEKSHGLVGWRLVSIDTSLWKKPGMDQSLNYLIKPKKIAAPNTKGAKIGASFTPSYPLFWSSKPVRLPAGVQVQWEIP